MEQESSLFSLLDVVSQCEFGLQPDRMGDLPGKKTAERMRTRVSTELCC